MQAQTSDASTLEISGKSEMNETSEFTSAGVSLADGPWISAAWTDSKIKLVEKIAEMIQAEEPNTVLNHQALNAVLRTLLSGNVDLWVAYRMEEGKTVISGLALGSKHIGSAVGLTSYTIAYVYAVEHLKPVVLLDGLKKILERAKVLGCRVVCANTDSKSIQKFAEKLGAKAKIRVEWELK